MNYTLDVHFKKEPTRTSEFSYQPQKNWMYLWVNNVYTGGIPFTYTIEEALEDFCEQRGQMFLGISTILGHSLKYGTYLWVRL